MTLRRRWAGLFLPLVLVLLVGAWAPRAVEAAPSGRPSGRAATTVNVAVSRSVATAGSPVVVSGAVSGPRGRAVVLETRVDGSWRTLAKGRTDQASRFRLRLPTTWYHRHTLRVRAPSAAGSPAGTSRTRTVRVVASYEPTGERSDYTLPYDNYRWNPCTSITWRFHQGGGFPGSRAVVKRALVEISRGTGLSFTYRGTTTKVPVRDPNRSAADLLIGWATPAQVPQLSGGTAGYGGTRGKGPSSQRLEIYEAFVALDQTESLATTYADLDRVTWGQVMVHELGHAIGLGHTSAPDQVMFGTATTANNLLGRGDLRGMELVGLAQGCWDQGARP